MLDVGFETSPARLLCAGTLLFLALAHSVLGDKILLQPLFAQAWDVGISRKWVDRLLRFAWHATSAAWIALAAILLGASDLASVGIAALVCCLVVVCFIRAHLSWPFFLLCSLGAFWGMGLLGPPAAKATALTTACALLLIALVHVYWGLGGKRGLSHAVPVREGSNKPLISVGPFACFAVAIMLFAYAATVWLAATRLEPFAVTCMVGLGTLILVARAVGDGRTVGFTKRVRTTGFGRADDLYFTPLVVLLAIGSAAALLA